MSEQITNHHNYSSSTYVLAVDWQGRPLNNYYGIYIYIVHYLTALSMTPFSNTSSANAL